MSVERWAVLCGLYYEPETVTPLFTEGLTEMDDAVLRAWWPTIGGDAFIDHRIRATLIRDPLVRYLHRCIVTSITGRGASQEWVTMRDLFFLYCLMIGRPCNLARCLASYFASYYRRQVRGRIYGGSYITLVARARGYFALLEQMPAVEPQRLDRRTLFGMQVVQEFPDIGLRFSLAAGVIWQPQPHPPPQPAHDQEQVVQVQVQDPHPPPPPPPPQPPQHPRHVYRAVRLPEQLERLLQEVVESTRQMGRRLDRIEDLVHWQVQIEIERAAREGTHLPPIPRPRHYPDAPGTSGAAGDTSDAPGTSGGTR